MKDDQDQKIIDLMEEFEKAWKSGKCPRPEEFLASCFGDETVLPVHLATRQEILTELRTVEQEFRQEDSSWATEKSVIILGNYCILPNRVDTFGLCRRLLVFAPSGQVIQSETNGEIINDIIQRSRFGIGVCETEKVSV